MKNVIAHQVMNKRLITILGPTACGKTAVATQLAARIGGEIISADSRQVYRRMDIGTGKDLKEYTLVDGTRIPYHLIDIVEPGTKYNLYMYQKDFKQVYDNIMSRGKTPVLCGGTGLYIESILRDYQLADVPEDKLLREELKGKSLSELTEMLKELKRRNGTCMHNTTDVDTAQRAIRAIEIEMHSGCAVEGNDHIDIGSPIVIGINVDRELRRKRITERLHARLQEGMVEEVRGLLDEGIKPEDLIYYGLEYKYLTMYVLGQLTYSEMTNKLEIAIHQFAKRQMTWFRGMERRGVPITWIDGPREDNSVEKVVDSIMEHV